jgi:ParB-like chromosome segregation protein Spo0J
MAAFSDAVPPLAMTYRPVGALRPDPRNARTHPKQQVDQTVASIRQFGFVNPILADPDGHIIAGHGRLIAAKALGLTEVPTIYIRGLSETQKRALRIADNKIALGARWDLEVLRLELAELRSLDLDFDLSVTGFSMSELEFIFNDRADPDDDVTPEPPASPRTRRGDIWLLGEHRIGCGDARDLDFVRCLVGEKALIDAAFLDPLHNAPIFGQADA